MPLLQKVSWNPARRWYEQRRAGRNVTEQCPSTGCSAMTEQGSVFVPAITAGLHRDHLLL